MDDTEWKMLDGWNIVFLMVLLRISDYLQMDKTRTDSVLLKLKTFNSPVSLREHQTHLAVRSVNISSNDPELLHVVCNKPDDAQMYVKIQTLIKDIQNELDLSWAVLGEIYGFQPDNKPKIKFRRIDSNLTGLELDYVPQKISFQVNNELSKLLVAPLYGDNPTYGVRELVQNATDACKERMKIEKDKGNTNYESQALVTVSINKINDEEYLFKITDNGKGMTLDEILHYFLSVGSSFRQSLDWKKEFEGKVTRNGRFGVGVLAAFLLGDIITVKTKSYKENAFAYIFTTNKAGDFINVKKLKGNFDTGTEIGIIMSKYTFDRLIVREYGIAWTKWYIGKVPIVQYLLNGEKQLMERLFNPLKIRKIHPVGYEKVQWSYTSSHIFTSVFCNDILVPSFRQPPFPDKSVISLLPDVHVTDTQGSLPLKLDRNNLETKRLPFEDELLTDISKDLIANLLMIPIFSPKEIQRLSISPYNMDFLYLVQGYTLDVDYFINKIENNFHLLNILINCNTDVLYNADMILKQSNDYIIFVHPKEAHYGNHNDYVVSEDCLALLLVKALDCEVFPYLHQSKGKVIWENDDYLFFNHKQRKKTIDFFGEDNIGAIMKKMKSSIESIEEISLKHFKKNAKKSGTILNQLFEQYFGDNIIIPYNMEERKKLYPLAFEELKDYMKDYE
jgi:hypothetical protein